LMYVNAGMRGRVHDNFLANEVRIVAKTLP
jgi:hypothetical protein